MLISLKKAIFNLWDNTDIKILQSVLEFLKIDDLKLLKQMILKTYNNLINCMKVKYHVVFLYSVNVMYTMTHAYIFHVLFHAIAYYKFSKLLQYNSKANNNNRVIPF